MRLSVVVPCFNAQDDLLACLQSLNSCLHEEDEVVIVDDCSTDGTAEVAFTQARSNPRITVVTHSENQGVSQARNSGVRHATGDVVGFVDPDDIVTLEYRSTLVPPFETTETDICVGRHRVMDTGRGLDRLAPYPDQDADLTGAQALVMMARRRLPSSVCFMAFRRTFLIEAAPFRPGTRFEDFVFLADNFAEARHVVLSPTPVYIYRRGHVSETGILRPSVLDLLLGSQAMSSALHAARVPDATALASVTDASIRVAICDQAAVFGHEDPELARRVTATARQTLDASSALAAVRAGKPVLGAQVLVLSLTPSAYGAAVRIVRRVRPKLEKRFIAAGQIQAQLRSRKSSYGRPIPHDASTARRHSGAQAEKL